MPDANAIPVIDLGPYFAGEPGALDHAAAELRHALTEIGFYTIVNHGVPSALVHEVYRQVARFHARPLDEKLKIKLDKHNVGYLPMIGDTLRTSVVAHITKPNMSEAFFMARDLAPDHPNVVSGRRFRSANQWPGSLPGFREPLVEYCDATRAAGATPGARLCPRARPARHILRWALHRLPVQAARDPLPFSAEGARR
jgi:isopenicillin N synthase-like dioxygenase